jgi:membrane associated rhomboid family serine protease
MKNLSAKLRIIYKRLVLITIAFLLTYTLLHWLLFIKAGIPLREDWVKLWLPIGLSWIPILLWLRPRINLLQFKNENASFGYQMLACAAMAIPTIVAQHYLSTATGRLTKLQTIAALPEHAPTKYYSLDQYAIDTQHIGIQNTASVSGRYDEHLDMTIYIVLSILKDAHDTTTASNRFWLGTKYQKQVSNRQSDQEKESAFETFAFVTQQEFEQTDFRKFNYLERIGNTDDHDEYNRAINEIAPGTAGDAIIFEAQTQPFKERNGQTFTWILISLGLGLLAFLIALLFPKFDADKRARFERGVPVKDPANEESFDFLLPKAGFFTTPILIYINLLVYILMVVLGLGFISFKGPDLLNWGANFRPLTTTGEWWRLLTSVFLHGGLMHLLANMYGLLFVGIFLEPLLGKTKFAFVYLLTGLVASLASIGWYEATISVGASGAIFGLYGFFLAALLLKVFPPDFGKAFLTSTLIFVGFNLLMGFTGSTDNAAHIGGLLSGFVLGLFMAGRLKGKLNTTDLFQ